MTLPVYVYVACLCGDTPTLFTYRADSTLDIEGQKEAAIKAAEAAGFMAPFLAYPPSNPSHGRFRHEALLRSDSIYDHPDLEGLVSEGDRLMVLKKGFWGTLDGDKAHLVTAELVNGESLSHIIVTDQDEDPGELLGHCLTPIPDGSLPGSLLSAVLSQPLIASSQSQEIGHIISRKNQPGFLMVDLVGQHGLPGKLGPVGQAIFDAFSKDHAFVPGISALHEKVEEVRVMGFLEAAFHLDDLIDYEADDELVEALQIAGAEDSIVEVAQALRSREEGSFMLTLEDAFAMAKAESTADLVALSTFSNVNRANMMLG